MSVLNPLYRAVAYLLVHIYYGVSPILGKGTGASWVVSVVLLTIAMRLVLFPVFVKQIRSQRAMQALQPRMKELQAKYKNDKERLNQEMMALWKETGTNPFAGCLPLVLQIPIFISLYHTLNKLKPSKNCIKASDLTCYSSHVEGLSQSLIRSAANAKIFGVPFAAAFDSSAHTLKLLGGGPTSTRVLCAILTVIMVATTFITQRQLMARNSATADSQMAQQQKILLYIFPLFFLIYGYRFPIGVLFYWLTSNVWSMGQQFVVIRRMDAAPATIAPAGGPSGPAVGAKPQRPQGPRPAAPPKPAAEGPATPPPAPRPKPSPAAPRRPNGRNRKKRGRR